jgi:hypothetical protein
MEETIMKKEMAELLKNLNAALQAFERLTEKAIIELDGILEKVEPSVSQKKKESEPKLPEASPQTPSEPEESALPEKPEGSLSILDAVQQAIEKNPGIDTKSLREKTGFETNQIRNVVPVLKKKGKIKAEKGKYFPIAAKVVKRRKRLS